jgi:hypothetical protein
MARKSARPSSPVTRLRLTLAEGERDAQAFRAETLREIILAEAARQEGAAARQEEAAARQEEAAAHQEDAEESEDDDANTEEERAHADEDDADAGEELEDADVDEDDADVGEEDSEVPMPGIPSAHRALAMPVVRPGRVHSYLTCDIGIGLTEIVFV